MHHLIILLDCQTLVKRWIEVTPEFLSGDTGAQELGLWLISALADITEAHNKQEEPCPCMHLQTLTFTHKEFAALEVESLLERCGSDSPH